MSEFTFAGFPGSNNRFTNTFFRKTINGNGITFSNMDVKPKEKLTVYFHETFQIGYNIELKKKVIHLIRNPLDAIYSRIKNGHGHDDPVEVLYKTDKSLPKHKRYAHAWNNFVDAGLKHRTNPNYFEMRYEDFCLKPEETLKKLCSFLEIEYQEKFLNNAKKDIKFSVDKHKKLSQEKINEIQEITKINREKFGYV